MVDVPDAVQRKARSYGDAGVAWLEDLPRLLARVAAAWQLDIGRTLSGGSASYVVEATTRAGALGVLKLPIPGENLGRSEARTLLAARGAGYASVLRYDESDGALLLERLGPTLETLGLSTNEQIAHICRTLQAAWRRPAHPNEFTNGAQKAHDLARFIEKLWHELDEPCTPRAVETALRFADARKLAFDPARAVLAHGDAHASNTLLVPGSEPRQFKFVDPDGLFIEPAYDLAIPMRDWGAELMDGDALELGWQRCRLLSDLTGVESEPIWQWGFIERMSTGLLLLSLDYEALAAEFLSVADAWSMR